MGTYQGERGTYWNRIGARVKVKVKRGTQPKWKNYLMIMKNGKLSKEKRHLSDLNGGNFQRKMEHLSDAVRDTNNKVKRTPNRKKNGHLFEVKRALLL